MKQHIAFSVGSRRFMRCLAAAGALCLLLGGCGGPAQPASDPAVSSGSAVSPGSAVLAQPIPSPSPAQPTPDVPAPALPPLPTGFRWEKEPWLALDGLAPVSLFRGTREEYFNTLGLVSRDGWCEAWRDGKVGLLAPDGEWITDCEYSYILCGFDEQYVLTKRVEGAQWGLEEYVFDDNGRPRCVEPGETNPDGSGVTVSITGTSMGYRACWVDSLQRLRCYNDLFLGDFYSGMPQYPLAAFCLPDDTEDTMRAELFADSWADKEKYALIVDGQPVSAERYQEMGCVAEGIVAAKKDGRWGYLDLGGETVIPFAYDPSWQYYDEQTGSWTAAGCFNATEGCVVLCQNGEYALYSAAGEELIPFGLFEQLLPVYGGRLWARQNGLWGILRLEQAG